MHSHIKRVYINHPLNLNHRIALTTKQFHYIKNVIRLKKNDFLRIFNGKDVEWLSKIEKIDKKNIYLVLEKKIRDQKNSPDICLVFSSIKKDRLNILIQKCTELGLSSFIPIKSARSNILNINFNNLIQNTIEAAQQSERLDVPSVYDKKKIDDIGSFINKDSCLIYCDENNINSNNLINTIQKIRNKFKKWFIIIGPEGGFSMEERNKILEFKNTYSVTLGKRILRSDTAATAAIFTLQQFIDN